MSQNFMSHNDPTRRDFLAGSAAAGATFLLGGKPADGAEGKKQMDCFRRAIELDEGDLRHTND
jgi:hypothetical protein